MYLDIIQSLIDSEARTRHDYDIQEYGIDKNVHTRDILRHDHEHVYHVSHPYVQQS